MENGSSGTYETFIGSSLWRGETHCIKTNSSESINIHKWKYGKILYEVFRLVGMFLMF
jgi:hypothetical protein